MSNKKANMRTMLHQNRDYQWKDRNYKKEPKRNLYIYTYINM